MPQHHQGGKGYQSKGDGQENGILPVFINQKPKQKRCCSLGKARWRHDEALACAVSIGPEDRQWQSSLGDGKDPVANPMQAGEQHPDRPAKHQQ